MNRRSIPWIVFGAGLILLSFGVPSWQDHHAAIETATGFLQAMLDGEREAAMIHLDPVSRREWIDDPEGGFGRLLKPDDNARLRVQSADIGSAEARVRVRLEQRDRVLQPVLVMERNNGADWMIVSIENLPPDATTTARAGRKPRSHQTAARKTDSAIR